MIWQVFLFIDIIDRFPFYMSDLLFILFRKNHFLLITMCMIYLLEGKSIVFERYNTCIIG